MGSRDPVAGKGPIYAETAEQSVLGALLLDNEALDQVSDLLCADDFYVSENGAIFRAIQHLLAAGKQADSVTVGQHLIDTSARVETPLRYLNELVVVTPSAANVRYYAEIVRDRAVLRRLVRIATKITESAHHPDGKPAHAIVDEAQAAVMAVSDVQQRASDGFLPLNGFLGEVIGHVGEMYEREDKSEVIGLPTGFKDLDELTAGLMPGDFVVVAARPSMGKTSLAMNIAEHVAADVHEPVAVVSMEMAGFQLAMRMLSGTARINQHRLRVGRVYDSEWDRITHAVGRLENAPLYIQQQSAVTPSQLCTAVRRLKRQSGGKLSLLVVDYLQLMQVERPTQNRAADLSEISRALKKLAVSEGIPVIALAQVNRGVEQRPNKRPVMSDIKDCGGIEQDADHIWFIYRDEVYNPDSQDKGTAELIVAKQRNGALTTIRLAFRGDATRFEDFVGGPQG